MVGHKRKLYIGQRIGLLIVRQYVRASTKGSYNTRIKVLCDCTCGQRITVPEYYLIRKNPKQDCGNHKATFQSTHQKEWRCFNMMHVRCTDPNHVAWRHYGGRGIAVCERWSKTDEGFRNFIADMGRRPSLGHTLDRKDPNGNYEPTNVRWATWKEQNNNKRIHYLPKA